MYAIIETGGKQYRVSQGQRIKVETLDVAAGDTVNLDKILMVANGETIKVGAPYVAGGQVTAKVTSHGRGEKIRVVKFRRRKHYRKTSGHRQNYTELEITTISG
ncbi:MAG: 50S ribosomal protein L21 [Gammaproteobacteria bacterium]|nr:50S ribosomal protein L21 [Gammaproteobacteria bacterium]